MEILTFMRQSLLLRLYAPPNFAAASRPVRGLGPGDADAGIREQRGQKVANKTILICFEAYRIIQNKADVL